MNFSLLIFEVKTTFEKIQEQIPKSFMTSEKKQDEAERDLLSAFFVHALCLQLITPIITLQQIPIEHLL